MKALIAVASRHGSTIELGRRLGAVLGERGLDVRVSPAEKVESLNGYSVVVLGSAVYASKMLPTMTALAYRWRDQLARRATYLFCSGPVDAPDPSAAPLPHDARQLVRISGIRDARMFGGAVFFDRLRPTERASMRMWGTNPGDYRDWDRVVEWGEQIADDVLGRV
ncbi:MAG: flavodoxin domain-containing protein [Bifidobacteriaceae bacterium]|nr:flavodoxin domain-containing protein [Bifidobacteriaceae bacterium]